MEIATRLVNLEYRLKFWMNHDIPQRTEGLKECLSDLREMKENILLVNPNTNEATKLWNEIKMCKPREMVDHPEHYQSGGLEAIDVMKAFMTEEQFQGFLIGSILKYMLRADKKGNALQDYKKANWYLEYLIKELENE